MYSISLILVFIASADVSYSDDCPSHLSRTHLFSHGNDCIQLVTNHHRTWKDARQDCQYQGGDLVQIRNAETQRFITDILRQTVFGTTGYWIGATDSDQEGIWEWVSGDRVSNYSEWASGQGPSHHGGFLFEGSNTFEDCAVIKPMAGYTWHDYSCSNLHLYICQYSKTQTTISPLSAVSTTETQVPTTKTPTTITPAATRKPPPPTKPTPEPHSTTTTLGETTNVPTTQVLTTRMLSGESTTEDSVIIG